MSAAVSRRTDHQHRGVVLQYRPPPVLQLIRPVNPVRLNTRMPQAVGQQAYHYLCSFVEDISEGADAV